MIDITKVLRTAERFVIQNSPAILSALGVAGTLATGYFATKATIQAVEKVRAENNPDMTKAEVVALVWQDYIPAVGAAAFTITTIIGAHHVNTRRAAAIATAYSLSERAYTEYRKNVQDHVGEKEEQRIVDKIAQDQVDRRPVSQSGPIIITDGDVLFHDRLIGRYFKSSMEKLHRAVNHINWVILHRDYASLSDFYSELGLPTTDFSDRVGWTTDQLLELDISAVLTEDEKPCIAIGFNHRPINGYDEYSC